MPKKQNKKRIKAKSNAWFVPVRGSYLPASAAGWWTYLPFLVFLALTFIIAVKKTSSLLVAVLIIIPNWIAATVVMTYIATKRS